MSGVVQQYRHESKCIRIADARGLSRFFSIGSLAIGLNAVGTPQRLHFLCQLLFSKDYRFYTIHFDAL